MSSDSTYALAAPSPPPVSEGGERRSAGAFAAFFVVLLLWLAGCWAIVGTLVTPVLAGGWWTLLAAAVLLTVAPLLALIAARARGRSPGALVRLVVYRPFWYAQLLLLVLALVGLVGAIAGAPFGAAGVVGRAALIGATAIAIPVGAAGYAGARHLVVRQLDAVFPDLPAALDGLRIVQVTDTHVGPHTPRAHLDRIAAAIREARPDVVAVTGDLVDDHAADVDHFAAVLRDVSAPLGIWVSPGNHDVYAGWEAVRARLVSLPVTVLVNRAAIVERDGARLAIVGLGDPAGLHVPGGERAAPLIDAALAEIPAGAFTLALAHNPALWPALAARGVALTLSGHTHWGQLAIPARGWSLASPFVEHAMGDYRRGGSLLYVAPGTNYWGIPFRLGTPPEVTVITLRRGCEVGLRPAT